MSLAGAFIGAVLILLVAFGIWRATRPNINVTTVAPTQQLAPVIKNISISSDQEKQNAGRDYVIAITEPSMAPVAVSITRESTGTQVNTTFNRPPNGIVTSRILINQGELLRAPLPVSIQIKWTSEVSTSMMQMPAPKRWW